MTFPVFIPFGSVRLHPHFVFETAGYVIAFCLYRWLRKRRGDPLDDGNRWWMIAGAAMGALVGGKVLYWFEDPALTAAHWRELTYLMGGKTMVGALIGGLFGVELAKKLLRITSRSGDLFALPLCAGIALGRIGCFLTGMEDHTAGISTTLPWSVDFGDGVGRHPTQVYELLFVLALGGFLWRRIERPYARGDLFKMFMVAYFAFRLSCDFLKPDVR